MKQSPRDTGVGGVWRRRRGDRRTRGGRSPNLGGLSILREVVVGDVSVATGALTQVERRAAGRLLNSHLESAQCVGRQRRNQARSDARVSRLGFQQGQGSRARGNESQLPPPAFISDGGDVSWKDDALFRSAQVLREPTPVPHRCGNAPRAEGIANGAH